MKMEMKVKVVTALDSMNDEILFVCVFRANTPSSKIAAQICSEYFHGLLDHTPRSLAVLSRKVDVLFEVSTCTVQG